MIARSRDVGLLNTIETAFIESLKRIEQNAPTSFDFDPIQTSTDSVTIAEAVEVNVHTRADEEARLLRPMDGEQCCSRGLECEGLKIENGFTLVPYSLRTNDLRCLLCKRYDALSKYYGQTLNDITPTPFPWRNIVDVDGEYSSDACVIPTISAPIDPFVLHLRHQYHVRENRVEQHGVHFRSAPIAAGMGRRYDAQR